MAEGQWVVDTTTYTHLCRAGHADLLAHLAPSGVVLVPAEVKHEIERGRDRFSSIGAVEATSWARLVVLDEEENWTALQVKAQMGGARHEHLGECAVIAYSAHNRHVAVLDDRAAVAQAERLEVATIDTLWIVVEAYKELFDRDRERASAVVDDLLATGMYLPVASGESLFSWAYVEGLLP